VTKEWRFLSSLEKLNLDDYKPLREIVFKSLRESILNGRLKPGERLMEVSLAQQLGVSRTPVREAIRKLELEGLVVMLPRKGAYVSNVSLKEIVDVLDIRASLEGLAASIAAQRMNEVELARLNKIAEEFRQSALEADIEKLLKKDVEFHECIFKSTNNETLHQLINALWEKVYRFRVTYISDYESSMNLIEEHKLILDAIANQNSDLAKKYATEHIKKAKQFILDKMISNKEKI
jgi:DNA-binding GntR family transcriptional regulator